MFFLANLKYFPFYVIVLFSPVQNNIAHPHPVTLCQRLFFPSFFLLVSAQVKINPFTWFVQIILQWNLTLVVRKTEKHGD